MSGFRIEKSGSSTVYGTAQIKPSKNYPDQVLIDLATSERDEKTGESVPVIKKFKMNMQEFLKYIPRKVNERDLPNISLTMSFPSPKNMPTDGSRAIIEKLYSVRPEVGQFRFKIKGFFRSDKPEEKAPIKLVSSFKEKRELNAWLEFVVIENDWAGTVYPYTYWNVTAKYANFQPLLYTYTDADDGTRGLSMRQNAKVIASLLHMGGVLKPSGDGSTLVYPLTLAETDDPEAILTYIENCFKKADVTLIGSVLKGKPQMDTFKVYVGDTDFDDDDDQGDAEASEYVDGGNPAASRFDEE